MAVSIPLNCGFLGAGQMATALAAGWLRAGLLKSDQILAGDPVETSRRAFAEATQSPITSDNPEVIGFADLLIIAVKPQSLPALLDEIAIHLKPNTLVISIVAGVPIARFTEKFGSDQPIIRVMPNTPCLIGASATGIALGAKVVAAHKELVEILFNALGKAFIVPEKALDAVTGLSGSGPAYVYLAIEALADGGVKMGLPRDIAQALAAQTVLGSARMVLETKMHPGALKDAVCSPAGTTIAGVHELEKAGVRAAFINAVEAATLRAIELGK